MAEPKLTLDQRDTPLVGFRAWVMKADVSDVLHSVAMNTAWLPEVTTARCMCSPKEEPKHPAPDDACRCGLHARTTVEGVTEEYPYYPVHGYWAYRSTPVNGLMCMGAVLMWGKVLRGTRVIRAEHARVICLTDPAPEQLWNERMGNNNPAAISEERREQRAAELDLIAIRYNVPIIPMVHVTAYAAEFGDLANDIQ